MGSGSRLALLVQHSFRRISSHLPQEQQKSYSRAAAGSSFEADLAARAQQLQLQSGGGSAHLNWLLDACACTLATHSSLASLLSSQDLPVPQERADEVLSLLDACTSLHHMADDADRQLGRLQRALFTAGQALRAPHITRAKVQAAAHRLRTPCQQLDVTNMSASKHYRDQAHAALKRSAQAVPGASNSTDLATAAAALDGTLLISLLVLASTLSAFSAPITSSSTSGAMRSTCKLIARYCSKSTRSSRPVPLWAAPLQQLQRDLRQEELGAVFLEHQGLYSSAASLLAAMTADQLHNMQQVAQMRQGMESLHKRAQAAQACVSTLRAHLASLFQALLSLRLALLAPS